MKQSNYQVALTLKSRNEKTGPIPVSTTTAKTCPTACPLSRNGCYAEAGPLAIFWHKVTERKYGMAWEAFVSSVSKLPAGVLWRHNQAGDLPGNRETIDAAALAKLVAANSGKKGFTYTHYTMTPANKAAVKAANKAGFTINLSGNNLKHADKLAATKAGPVVVVLPAEIQGKQTFETPKGRRVVVCPATYRDDVNCMSCGLCARQRDVIVGFPAHGASKRKASVIATT